MALPVVHLTRATIHSARDATFIFTSPEALLDTQCGRRLFEDLAFTKEVKAVFFDECHLLEDW